MKVFFKILSCCLLAIITVTLSFTIYAIGMTANVKFDKAKLITYKQNTVFFDCKNKAMADVSNTPQTVRISDLPSHVKHSFIAIEDKRFYKHNGVDIKRILGATRKNLFSKSIREGASTISQQLIKNTHLTNKKTIERKLKEIKLTRELEKNYTKNEILEMYLNTIYFGENSYGIQSASNNYFSKNATELSPTESALLAAIIKAPSLYSPTDHPERALQRRNLVLKCMKEQGYVSNKDYSLFISTPIYLNKKPQEDGKYYLTYAKNQAEELLHNTPYGVNDNLKIYTYFNPDVNKIAEQEIHGMSQDCNYCFTAVNNKTRGIEALITDVGLAKRSPASTVKPWLIYAPAIEENEITIATKILDTKTDFNGFYPCNNNEEYHGYISAEDALIKSLNIPAAKLAACLGPKRLKDYASKFDVTTEGNLSVALGDVKNGMSLKHVCDCYSVFSSSGNYEPSSFIKRITDKDNKILYEHTPKSNKIFSDSTVYIINDTLQKCAEIGTAKKINCGLPLCSKTGTNGTKKGNFDAYSISYCPEYTLGVWLGNADYTPMKNSVSGGTYPTIIACEIWKNLSKITPITKFAKPQSVVKVSINSELYDKDCVLLRGNGKSFLFTVGTEPPFPLTITDIQQSLNSNSFSLSFNLNGYHGAEIYLIQSNRKTLITDTTTHPATVTGTIKGSVYSFYIHPYTLEKKGRKQYGQAITIDGLQHGNSNKKGPPTEKRWWDDD